MSAMQQIKHAVSKDHLPANTLTPRERGIPIHDFGRGKSRPVQSYHCDCDR